MVWGATDRILPTAGRHGLSGWRPGTCCTWRRRTTSSACCAPTSSRSSPGSDELQEGHLHATPVQEGGFPATDPCVPVPANGCSRIGAAPLSRKERWRGTGVMGRSQGDGTAVRSVPRWPTRASRRSDSRADGMMLRAPGALRTRAGRVAHPRTLTVALLLAALVVAGCNAAPSAPPAAPPTPTRTPQEQAFDWTESVCGAIVPVMEYLTAAPRLDLGAREATRQAYLTYLTEAWRGRTGRGLPWRPPDRLRSRTATSSPSWSAARSRSCARTWSTPATRSQGTDAGSAVGLGRAAVGVSKVVEALLNGAEVPRTLARDPALRLAYNQVPSCAQTAAIPGAPPPLPPAESPPPSPTRRADHEISS